MAGSGASALLRDVPANFGAARDYREGLISDSDDEAEEATEAEAAASAEKARPAPAPAGPAPASENDVTMAAMAAMSPAAEEAWQRHALPQEVQHLVSIKLGAQEELDPARLARVLSLLRARPADPPRELSWAPGDVDDPECIVLWRRLDSPGGAWPVSPKVAFERRLKGTAPDLGELEGKQCQKEVVSAWRKWRQLPEEEKHGLAREFRERSEACVRLIREEYAELCEPENAACLLAVFLSGSGAGLDAAAVLAPVHRALADKRVLEAELADFPPPSYEAAEDFVRHAGPLGSAERNRMEQVVWQWEPRQLRCEAVAAALAGPLEVPCYAAFEERARPALVKANEALRASSWGGKVGSRGGSADPRAVESAFPPSLLAQLGELVAPWREWQLMRQHAMLALLPLLPTLSPRQCLWLVYSACSRCEGAAPIAPFGTGVDAFGCLSLDTQAMKFAPCDARGGLPRETDFANIVGRLFACRLPENIVQALFHFVLDEHVPNHDGSARLAAAQLLARHATESPETAHALHAVLSEVLHKAMRRADPSQYEDATKQRRLRASFLKQSGQCAIDQDFVGRIEVAGFVEAIIDCNAASCIEAVRQVYHAAPAADHSPSYGRHGLLGVHWVMGLAHQLREIEIERARRFAVCARCGQTAAPGVKLLTCSRCKLVRYCSAECQRKDWKSHKPRCQPAPAEAEAQQADGERTRVRLAEEEARRARRDEERKQAARDKERLARPTGPAEVEGLKAELADEEAMRAVQEAQEAARKAGSDHLCKLWETLGAK